ncbi:MAG: DUF58 domain-containing protein [Anaerolineae bacterium]
MKNFVPFLLILFVIAAFLRVDFFFTIVYLLFAVYLLSRLWTRCTVHHLRVQRRFTDHAFCGERVTVDTVVHNASWLPIPWLEVHESLPIELTVPPFYRKVVSLGPRERRHFHYMLHCRRRGYYPVGPLKMQTGDLLGIVRQSQAQVEPEHVIVYPRVVPLQQLGLPTRSPLVSLPAHSPLFEDPARVRGVRDYQQGDSLRRIHWTATASTGRLLVKQYQPAIARETLICLDLDEAGYERRQRYTATELAIVTAASIANHIIVRERLPAGLATAAWDPLLDDQARFFLPPRPERAHLMSLLEVLARVQITSATPFADLLRQEGVNLSWGATLAVITGRESEELFDTLVYLRRAGFAVALILVQSARPSAELQKRADLLGVPIHRVWSERDLETWQ